MTKIRKLWKENKNLFIFSILAVLCILAAIAAPLITSYGPTETNFLEALQAPSRDHWFGTDALGRDVYTRVIYGARTSIRSTMILLAVVFVVGTFLGIIAGVFGGVADAVIMRIADTMIAFPDLILAIAIAGILGPSLVNSMIAIAVVSWTKYARLARSMVLKIKNREFIAAAKVSGSKKGYLILNYYVPGVLPTVIVTAATDIGTIMLSLASLSFLGFGVQPPTPEWGYMLSEGRTYLLSAPWLLFCPGIVMFLVVAVFNMMGDGVRDLLDPKSGQKTVVIMGKKKKKKTA